jgi:hypothetical protein
MATIESERTTHSPRPERPVFVADDDRRARRLRRGAAATAVLACLWLAALAVGMLGFGKLPDVSLPALGGDEHKGQSTHPTEIARAASQAVPADSADTQARQRSAPIEARVARPRAAFRARAAASAAPAAPAASRHVTRPVPPGNIFPPQPVTAPPLQRGWLRRGWITPPGQTRRAQRPPAPPVQSHRRGGQTATTPTTAQLPPGQQKPKPRGPMG